MTTTACPTVLALKATMFQHSESSALGSTSTSAKGSFLLPAFCKKLSFAELEPQSAIDQTDEMFLCR